MVFRNHIIPVTFEFVDRIDGMPLKQQLQAFRNILKVIRIALGIAREEVEDDPRDIAFHLVAGLEEFGVSVTAASPAPVGDADLDFISLLHFPEALVAAGTVDARIGRAEMMQVGPRTAFRKPAQGLGPYMFSVPGVTPIRIN